jgi:uncharacterized protein YceK
MKKIIVLFIVCIFLTGCSYKIIKTEDEKDRQINELTQQLNDLKTQQTNGAVKNTNSDSSSTIKNNNLPTTPTETNTTPSPENKSNTNTTENEGLKITNIQTIPGSYETIISWDTNLLANGKVILWPTNTPTGNLIVSTSNTKHHSVNLVTIPDKTYNYNIESTTTDGKKVVSEQKEVTTPIDNTSPIISANLLKDGTGIYIKVFANEQIISINTYNFNNPSTQSKTIKDENSINSDIQKKLGRTLDPFSNTQEFWLSLPDSGWNTNTELEYQITAYDQSYNKTTIKNKIKISNIPNK